MLNNKSTYRIAIFLLILFAGCKKDGVGIENGLYIRFSINGGEEIEFVKFANSVLYPPEDPIAGGYVFIGFAQKDESINTINSIGLGITSRNAFKSNTEYKYSTSGESIALNYTNASGNRYDLLDLTYDQRLHSDAKVKIISLTENSFKGIFSGTVYNSDNANDSMFLRGTFSLRE